jgi:uncharacterized protein (TIGR03435 family)
MELTAKLLLLAAASLALPSTVLAQPPAAPAAQAQPPFAAQPDAAPASVAQFDVISVKPDKTNGGTISLRFIPDGLNATNVPVHMLLAESYALNDDQILGEPDWSKTDRFDIEAKVAGPDVATLPKLNFDQRRSMFRQILADRFMLATHHETKELPVFALFLAKGGVKFKESKPDPEHPVMAKGAGRFMIGRGKISAQATTMPFFASVLSRQVGRTVVDKTGLTGTYDVTLDWTPDEGAGPPPGGPAPPGQPDHASSSDSGPSIFTAIQEQLGLKLESAKGPVDVLVIDHIEKPSEN